jgi:DNA-binding response OmpR family regulator
MALEEHSHAVTNARARVLIVDDNVEVVDLLSEFLSREGYALGCADNGHDALDMILDEAFDAVLLDITLPGIDGLEVLRRIRAKGVLVPIIILTASSDEAVALETLRAGAFDYVAKPFDFAYLAQTLAAAVVHRRRTSDAADAPPQERGNG